MWRAHCPFTVHAPESWLITQNKTYLLEKRKLEGLHSVKSNHVTELEEWKLVRSRFEISFEFRCMADGETDDFGNNSLATRKPKRNQTLLNHHVVFSKAGTSRWSVVISSQFMSSFVGNGLMNGPLPPANWDKKLINNSCFCLSMSYPPPVFEEMMYSVLQQPEKIQKEILFTCSLNMSVTHTYKHTVARWDDLCYYEAASQQMIHARHLASWCLMLFLSSFSVSLPPVPFHQFQAVSVHQQQKQGTQRIALTCKGILSYDKKTKLRVPGCCIIKHRFWSWSFVCP